MLDPSAPERALYDVNLVTYNGGFHLLLAALSFLVRPETAGSILLSLYPLAFAYAALALVRVAGTPPLVRASRAPHHVQLRGRLGLRQLLHERAVRAHHVHAAGCAPSAARRGCSWKVMLASFFLSYTHVLATLCLCVMIGVAGLASRFATLGDLVRARLIASRQASASPCGPPSSGRSSSSCTTAISPHANWEGWDDGLDDPLWYKLLHVTAYSVGQLQRPHRSAAS